MNTVLWDWAFRLWNWMLSPGTVFTELNCRTPSGVGELLGDVWENFSPQIGIGYRTFRWGIKYESKDKMLGGRQVPGLGHWVNDDVIKYDRGCRRPDSLRGWWWMSWVYFRTYCLIIFTNQLHTLWTYRLEWKISVKKNSLINIHQLTCLSKIF